MDDRERLANHISLVQSLNDLELEVNLVENTLTRPNLSKAVCLNLSNSLRLSQERNRAILSTVAPNDSAARADTQCYFHLQAKIHELFIVGYSLVASINFLTLLYPVLLQMSPILILLNTICLRFLFLNSMRNFLNGRISGDYFLI